MGDHRPSLSTPSLSLTSLTVEQSSLGGHRGSWLRPSSVSPPRPSPWHAHPQLLTVALASLPTCDLKHARKGRKAVLLGAPLHAWQRSISTVDACPSHTTPLEHVLHQGQQHPPHQSHVTHHLFLMKKVLLDQAVASAQNTILTEAGQGPSLAPAAMVVTSSCVQ